MPISYDDLRNGGSILLADLTLKIEQRKLVAYIDQYDESFLFLVVPRKEINVGWPAFHRSGSYLLSSVKGMLLYKKHIIIPDSDFLYDKYVQRILDDVCEVLFVRPGIKEVCEFTDGMVSQIEAVLCLKFAKSRAQEIISEL